MTRRQLLESALLAPLGLLVACGGAPAEEKPGPEPIRLVLTPQQPQLERRPHIKRISVPQRLISGVPMLLSISVEGLPGEALSFSLIPAMSGGTFSPTQGSLTLQEAVYTFAVQHVPPPVSSSTVFTHALEVTNAAGNSSLTAFETRVWPSGSRFTQDLQTYR